MNKPHKHAEAIKAWADGAEIEYSFDGKHWSFVANPSWTKTYKYRIKPEPKSDVVVYSQVVGKFLIGCDGIEIQQLILRPSADNPNIKYTFDGEWGNLKSAEVI
jgi:hypothetical protein